MKQCKHEYIEQPDKSRICKECNFKIGRFKSNLNIRVDKAIIEMLRQIAKIRYSTPSEIVRRLIVDSYNEIMKEGKEDEKRA